MKSFQLITLACESEMTTVLHRKIGEKSLTFQRSNLDSDCPLPSYIPSTKVATTATGSNESVALQEGGLERSIVCIKSISVRLRVFGGPGR